MENRKSPNYLGFAILTEVGMGNVRTALHLSQPPIGHATATTAPSRGFDESLTREPLPRLNKGPRDSPWTCKYQRPWDEVTEPTNEALRDL
ncbi:hypothetical protein CRG98_045843 [Punica granatum]|uniref:Uncharacterized protein n=1 Tax=Punica granatum TaxID=22663 RepID=A0A2I0HQA5_PUNGR|nr:hypothetical protein CRG98_045843 [Punica granatum]